MAPSKIMIIRHGEKPVKEGSSNGVTCDGETDADSLIVRGWQRAGALCGLFSGATGGLAPPLARPNQLFAAGRNDAHHSRRPKQTLDPLALALNLSIDDSFPPGAEQSLAKKLLQVTGVVLIAWEHSAIKELVRAVTNGGVQAPNWPNRFDMIYCLDPTPWRLTQRPQMLLAGDCDVLFT